MSQSCILSSSYSCAVSGSSQFRRHEVRRSVQEGRRLQAVNVATASFAQAAAAVTSPNPGAAEMTGEWCQSPWSVTGSSGRISHAHTPLLSPIDSATSHYCQSERHCLRGWSSAAGNCPGQQGALSSMPCACQPPHRACLVRLSVQDATTKT